MKIGTLAKEKDISIIINIKDLSDSKFNKGCQNRSSNVQVK